MASGYVRDSWGLEPYSPDRNLHAVGAALADLGALPPAEFADIVRGQVTGHLSGLAAQLAGLLEKHRGEPAWWAADMRRVLTVLRGRLTQDDVAVPDDLVQAFGRDAAPAVFQRLAARFGWPRRAPVLAPGRQRDRAYSL